jgi:hypothetical protein
MADTQKDRNVRFSQLVASLPKRVRVVGQLADGTPLTVEVPSLFSETSDE